MYELPHELPDYLKSQRHMWDTLQGVNSLGAYVYDQ